MRVKRIWKPVSKASSRQEYMDHFRMIEGMTPYSFGSRAHWEFGTAAFGELRALIKESRRQCTVRTPEVLPVLTELWGFPLEENRSLPEYAVVLHYGEEEKDSMEEKICTLATMETYFVDTAVKDTEKWTEIADFEVNDGVLSLIDEEGNTVGVYASGWWCSLWKEDHVVSM